ncbi:TadE/TadG family type IV pilus assembly protein [Brevundimonas halotolerans]|uniref:Flp pilus assembly protein TadG n=1 Tax=Brevundimonas halotolerans TaxID=69670 RepID=A0A7W9A400_9CAUL|nr:TadE/TadG family type IV pilus assembly protein [Brevundimonas halotolerans]MBB5660989.1 Flp pilus assembly protein TadG [Brevundimonas halotolerans]
MGIRLWTERLKAFFEDRRGNVALIFGLSLPVMVLMTVGGVDIHRASTVRVNLQDALDASALAAARSPYTDPADIQRVGMDALRANLTNYPNIILREDKTTFVLTEDQVVVADGSVDVKALVANIFLPPYGQFMDDYLPVGAHSEVNRSSKNLEVSLVLDITGSMSGTRIADLKAAAKDLVTMIVQDQQTPYYSKVAIVPYSMGVNLGSWVNSARGAPVGHLNITDAAWAEGSWKSISDITRASPGVITANNHGFSTGDYVWIEDVEGMHQINDRVYRVVRINNNRFSLEYWAGWGWATLNTRGGDGYSKYDDDGRVRKCVESDCSVIITTASNHGLSDGDTVYITNVGGMTQINNTGYEVRRISADRYSIGVNGASWGSYTYNGRSWCGQYGCQWRVFRNRHNQLRWFEASSCVAERTGPQAYTDALTNSAARAQFNYSGTSSNRCPTDSIIPLSSDREGLKTAIDDFRVAGSTAGQIGTAWGWYTVSPNFNSLWPASAAAPYGDDDTLKAVIIMTDGEFNTPYCSGVIGADAGSGSGSTYDHIGCSSTNGDPFEQTLSLCAGMKAQGVIVYTVGFQVASGGGAERVIQNCASSSSHVYLPASGADLSEAFKAIGRDITRLRISK